MDESTLLDMHQNRHGERLINQLILGQYDKLNSLR
jgi:hypothetical protein